MSEEDGTLGQVCPEGWKWNAENAECECGPPVCPTGYAWDAAQRRCVPAATARSAPGCWPGYVWDAAQGKCVPATPTARVGPLTPVAPTAVLPQCPPGWAWSASQNRCVQQLRAGVSGPEEVRASVVRPDGTVSEEPVGLGDVGQVGQEGDGDAATTTTVRFRFPFSPLYVYPLVARFAYPPPYVVRPRPTFPVRATLFARALTSAYQVWDGWVPIGVIEVDNVATAIQIARCVGGALGPVGSTAPTQFP